MAQVTEYGYETLRNFIETSWKYIELQNDKNAKIIRLGVGDPRVNWRHLDGERTLKLEIKITGKDITLPATIAKIAIFDVATGGTVIASSLVEVTTLTQAIDELTVTASIQVPSLA